MNYLKVLPLHVHQQILELNGIKDSLYTIEECDGQLILFNPSDKKHIPSFMHRYPTRYDLVIRYNIFNTDIREGYVKVGKNLWFNGSNTITFKNKSNTIIFHIDEKAHNLLIKLCKAIIFSGRGNFICAHCSKNFTLELDDDGFSGGVVQVEDNCTCSNGSHVRHTFHKKCTDIKFAELECGCNVHQKCVKSCNTCKKIQCYKHGCQRTCAKCKEVHCQDLMFESKGRHGPGFLCEDCVVYCSHCKNRSIDYTKCVKCNILICWHCKRTLKHDHCLPCYDTLVMCCKFCEITKHEEDFVTCEQCNKKLCRDCLKRCLDPIPDDNGKIIDFDVRDVCADCVVEETITITKLK